MPDSTLLTPPNKPKTFFKDSPTSLTKGLLTCIMIMVQSLKKTLRRPAKNLNCPNGSLDQELPKTILYWKDLTQLSRKNLLTSLMLIQLMLKTLIPNSWIGYLNTIMLDLTKPLITKL